MTIVFAVALTCGLASAQTPNIQIIPAPRQVNPGEGSFSLTRDTRLILADPKSADDQFAAQDFIDDLKATGDISLSIGKGQTRRDILVGKIDSLPVAQALKLSGAGPAGTLNEEGYVIVANADRVIVAGNTVTGTFYGLQTLKQLVRGNGTTAFIPAVKIVDWPTMRWRGISDDISRGPVPTVDYIKRQIRNLAFFKMNMHSFYMEHTFASETHPLIGPEGGSLTPAEIRELVAYARKYHVELVPEQQTFGHLHKALRLEKYAELARRLMAMSFRRNSREVTSWWLTGTKSLTNYFPASFFTSAKMKHSSSAKGRAEK
jgi:N-acetyl-beta-hexosaminidase